MVKFPEWLMEFLWNGFSEDFVFSKISVDEKLSSALSEVERYELALQEAELRNQALLVQVEDLKSQVVVVNPLEEYWNNRRSKSTVFNLCRSGLDVDVRQFINPYDDHLTFFLSGTNDDKALKCLDWVRKNISYVSESKEFWQFSWESLNRMKGDCEDGAILMMNMMLRSGIPYWRIRLNAGDVKSGSGTEGHCYITYLNESDGVWYVLDWCFVDNRRTTISTTHGKRRFSQLNVDDEVISFNEKTGKIETSRIVKIGKRDVLETYRIRYLNATGKEEYVECTAEHPFYVNEKWKRADSLIVGDEIYGVQPRALFSLAGNHQKSEEHIKKIAETKRRNGDYKKLSERQTKNNIFTRNDVRQKLSENNAMKNPALVERVYSKRLKKGWMSQPEIKLMQKFKELNLPVRYTGDGSFWVKGNNPDFKVEGEKKVIEVTEKGYLGRGKDWAEKKKQHYFENGFRCKVVFYDKHQNNCSVLDNELVAFTMNGFRVTNINKLSKKKTVWNIHCEKNNNYFVNGMLVHNCYWPQESKDFGLTWSDAEGKYFGIWYSWNQQFAFKDEDFGRGDI